ncbi:MAG: 23S rRNA methyltransferase [Gammaproteobacteria bacterium RIFCSPHIGHO2_12_FULL_41_20]|nr:MAG: 23S rRNA methyltransferase [Gammaproteobacteria bacterium RIFCSPHIGHO2_12_FULL_41_20]
MANKGSSRRWLNEHFSDTYVKQAKQAGYRSRAAYKLLELQKKDSLFKPGMTVVDLGAAPGGWSQVVAQLVYPGGRVVALDVLPIEAVEGVEVIQGDFQDSAILSMLMDSLGGAKVDWIISDMAPNLSGINDIDIPRSLGLAELALDFAVRILQPEGGLLVKVFYGEGFEAFLTEIKRYFQRVVIRKPKASRSRSSEAYILARNRRIR